MRQLVCDSCREGNPSLMSCIHTFGPHDHKPAWAGMRERDLDEERKDAVQHSDRNVNE